MMNQIQIGSDLDLQSLRKFVREKILPGAKERDKNDEFPLALIKELHKMGVIQAFVPTELGGSGMNTSDIIAVAREIAYASPGIACTMAGNMLSLVPVFKFGSEKLKKQVASQVMDHPHSGSDILNIHTRAKKVPGGYSISGQKCFITNAGFADHFVVMAKMAHIENSKAAMTAFYIPAGTKGLSVGKPLEKLGQRESNTTEVFFDEVFVPEEHCIGGEGNGFKVAITSLERSRTLFAASAVGVCDRAFDLVNDFLGGREHYGSPLLSQPAIRSLLAQLQTEARAAWYLTCASASFWEAGAPELQHSSMAKMYSGQVAVKVTGAILELFGGWGFTREFEIERLYRDSKLFEIIEGPTFVQQIIIGKELFPERYVEKKAGKKAA
jgi:alkylation response protein AidB-like acyl-CoA dehydrogenase